jgi:hypothetical protein
MGTDLFVRSQEPNSYPVISEEWGADECVKQSGHTSYLC